MSDPRQTERQQRLRRAPRATVALVVPLGIAVLLGWLLRITALQRLHPSLPAMVPSTAVCLLLAAGALGGLRAGPRWFPLSWLASLLVAATGLVFVVSHALGAQHWPLPIPRAVATSSPAALTLLLLSLALLCTGHAHRRARALACWGALLALLPPLVSLTGYAFLERPPPAPGGCMGMAPHTAVALCLLALGTLTLDADSGLMRTLTSSAAGGLMARRMLPSLLLPLGVGALLHQKAVRGVLGLALFEPVFAVTMVLLLALVLWRHALALDRLSSERLEAEAQARLETERQRVLTHDNAQLHQAASAREEVLATVSHDLKNPLSAIRLSTTLLTSRLAGTPHEEPLGRQVRSIERAAATMLTLIHQLLDAARLDAGQALAITPRVEPLSPLLAEALARIEPLATQKSLRLEQRLAPDLSTLVDRERILQVLANLLGNAVKFTPLGGTLTVETRTVVRELWVSVRDTGPGIPSGLQGQLFERYWQARETARQGSGLGLYIARGIIAAHGGRLWVDSTPERGSTFTFSLPLPPPEPPREA